MRCPSIFLFVISAQNRKAYEYFFASIKLVEDKEKQIFPSSSRPSPNKMLFFTTRPKKSQQHNKRKCPNEGGDRQST